MEKLFSVSDVADFLGIKKSTVYKFVMKQKIPYVKIGARLLFDQARIEAWVREQSQPKAQGKEGGGQS